MAIQKKHGKGRLDKWYKLAKEKGYRARAAFKLIQLNKKYGLLEKSKVLIDLCAAPGSWCQVAAEVMPKQSLIVGVDLAPIKKIDGAITFQSDITTDKCRATLRQHLKTWKADTVLHDGAPNVGTAWVQDAFSQAELVLQSMKLATEFLVPGGTFVTKVFRSKDYNALLWVFKQLFTFVEATKPPSSRNVSAEIFVVCRGYKAPKFLDPKFLDPRHVFADVAEATPNNEAKVFNPEKKKRKREGYAEGDYTQHKVVPVSEFIQTTDPLDILANTNTLSFEQTPNGDLALATLDRLPETTDEIRTCCTDLKVLGKKEFRTLLKWRLKVRDLFGMSTRAKKQKEDEIQVSEEVAEVESMDEELQAQQDLQRLQEVESKTKRKERRKENERRQREVVRMQMNMTTPMDIGMEQVGPNGEGAVFNLKTAQKAEEPSRVAHGRMEEIEDESSESSEDDNDSDLDSDADGDRLDRELDAMFEDLQTRKQDRDAKLRAKKARKEKEVDDWEGFSERDGGATTDAETDDEDTIRPRLAPSQEGLSQKAAMFFDQDIFQYLGVEHIVQPEAEHDSAIELDDDSEEVKPQPSPSPATESYPMPKQRKVASAGPEDEDSEVEIETAPQTAAQQETSDDPRTKSGHFDIDIITAEAMDLAHKIATGEKTKMDVVDDAFNRYSLRDVDGLPEWFLNDESKHSKLQKPISAAAAAAIKEKLRALNARPIKKVREAKGRKKFKAAQKLEKLRKKSALLADDEGMSERDKASSIQKMMAKAAKKKPKQSVKLVVAKGNNRGISGRPRGVKGKYRIVDARLKKDVRGEKRAAKRKK